MFSNLNDTSLEEEMPENVVCWLFEAITEENPQTNQKLSKIVVL